MDAKTQKQVKSWKQVLKQRQKEVGKVRDQLWDDIDEMKALKDVCERAWSDIEDAIDALSELV